jgi:hypothetical protein
LSSPSNITTWEQEVMMPYAKSGIIAVSGPPLKFNFVLKLWELLGLTEEQYMSDDINAGASSMTSDPTQVIRLYFDRYNPNGSSVVLRWITRIDYETVFFDPTSTDVLNELKKPMIKTSVDEVINTFHEVVVDEKKLILKNKIEGLIEENSRLRNKIYMLEKIVENE